MAKIGILFGMEDTFPWALIERIKASKIPGVDAEPVKVGAITQGVPTGYRLILDRISQDVPFYRTFLKNEVLCGTQVLNDPFWASADDKFFENCLATKLGVAVPKTVVLPHKNLPCGTTDKSIGNAPRRFGYSKRSMQKPISRVWTRSDSVSQRPRSNRAHRSGNCRSIQSTHVVC
jgi:hypothetical protein